METIPIKLVVVGDGAVGKTSLIMTYITGKYPLDYRPTVFDDYVVNLHTSNDKIIELALWDTAGEGDYGRLRPLSYTNANVFIVCYSICSEIRLNNIKSKWIPEISHFQPDIPYIIVGTKLDLRDDEQAIARAAQVGSSVVTYEQGKQMAKEVKAVDYLECSSLTGKGVKTVFDQAVRVAFQKINNQNPEK